jgi:hypothetical protein
MKICSKCKVERPLTEYHKSSIHKGGHNPQCRTCFNKTRRENRDPVKAAAHAKAWYARNKHRVREKQIRVKYGLTMEQYSNMVTGQQNKCKICEKEMTGPKEPAIDHCHITGSVRDLLCANCNAALGLLQDDPDIIQNAARYVEYHNTLKADEAC